MNYIKYNTNELLEVKNRKKSCVCPLCKAKHNSNYIVCLECKELVAYLSYLYSVEIDNIPLEAIKQIYKEYNYIDKTTLQQLFNDKKKLFKDRFLTREEETKSKSKRFISSTEHICIYCKQIFIDKSIKKSIIFGVCKKCSKRKNHISYGIKGRVKIKLNKHDKVPKYVKELMKNNPNKEFISAEGDILNPNITYKCINCNKIITQTFDDIQKHKNHSCMNLKSKGEALFEKYLINKNIKYKTEYQTLKCINPKTGKILPYDFELTKEHCIVEIQGVQHYKYIPYFHKSYENFQERKELDKYKKEFALNKGYRYVEISSGIFDKSDYMKKVEKLLEDIK